MKESRLSNLVFYAQSTITVIIIRASIKEKIFYQLAELRSERI